jgi:TonB family protein
MTVTIRGNSNELRRSASLMLSLGIHAAALGWVMVSAGLGFDEKPTTAFEREVPLYEHKIIWYRLQTLVPDVRPAEAKPTPKTARAVRKFEQNLIAGAKELPLPPQKVWLAEAPKVDPPKPKLEPLPNLLAVAPAPKPPPRKFEPPPPSVKPKPVEMLADAPEVALKQAAITSKDLPFATDIPRPVRAFVPPPEVQRKVSAAHPDLAMPPEAVPVIAPAPTMAIVGLDPLKTMEIPRPPAPRDAGFSAGPKLNPEGESAPNNKAMLSLPGLYANGGPHDIHPLTAADVAPSSQRSLMAAMRTGGVPRIPAAIGVPSSRAADSPDPRMNGRMVYMMAIQIPNVTSFSGSWMVWFAEHEPLPGAAPREMRAPQPVRKVDPKYIADAVNERVEGIVRLAAVIRKDGNIEAVELLKHLDDRLDRSAEEALAKWRFQPAERDGTPVDVDAVFEIPFRLAPKITR